jgi:hypothetical protein
MIRRMPSGDESSIELGIRVGSVFNRHARLSPTFVKGVAPAHHRGDGAFPVVGKVACPLIWT